MEGVLTRYTDEVWGGLLPLVKQARQEIEKWEWRVYEGETDSTEETGIYHGPSSETISLVISTKITQSSLNIALRDSRAAEK